MHLSVTARNKKYKKNKKEKKIVSFGVYWAMLVFLSESLQSDRMTQSVWRRGKLKTLKTVQISDYFGF